MDAVNYLKKSKTKRTSNDCIFCMSTTETYFVYMRSKPSFRIASEKTCQNILFESPKDIFSISANSQRSLLLKRKTLSIMRLNLRNVF